MKINNEPKRISIKVSKKESLEKKIEIATQTLAPTVSSLTVDEAEPDSVNVKTVITAKIKEKSLFFIIRNPHKE